MARTERPGQKQYAEGVKRIHRKEFQALHCRVCPLGRTGFDRNGKEIPLEAHHAKTPYSIDQNQDPRTGALICSDIHKKQIHTYKGLARAGIELLIKFREEPKKKRFNLSSLLCPYKDEDNVQ
jgi:hypothetical protein